MEYTEIAKSRGKLYVCENQLYMYIQHSIKKGVRYLKCINEDCMAMIINVYRPTPCVKKNNSCGKRCCVPKILACFFETRCRYIGVL